MNFKYKLTNLTKFIPVVCMIFFLILNITIMNQPIIYLLIIGCAFIVISFVKEIHIIKSAELIYLVLLLLAIINILFDLDSTSFYIVLKAIVPIPVIIETSKIIAKYKYLNFFELFLITGVYLMPIILIYYKSLFSMLFFLVVGFWILIMLKVEKKIIYSWRVFIIIAIVATIIFLLYYKSFSGSYFQQKIYAIITQGNSDPNNIGYIRIMTNELLKKIRMFSSCKNNELNVIVSGFGFDKTFDILKQGYFYYVCICLCEIIMGIFLLISTRKQGDFTKLFSSIVSTSFILRTLLASLSIFYIGPVSAIFTPFFGSDYQIVTDSILLIITFFISMEKSYFEINENTPKN